MSQLIARSVRCSLAAAAALSFVPSVHAQQSAPVMAPAASGTLEEVLVSPVSHWDIVLGRTLTGLMRGLFSSLMILLVGIVSGGHLHLSAAFFFVLALTAFCFGAAGVAGAFSGEAFAQVEAEAGLGDGTV